MPELFYLSAYRLTNNMEPTNSKAPDIYGEIDYLWTAMKTAQEESVKITDAYAVNKRDADALRSRLAHLEKSLLESSERERALKADIASLNDTVESDAVSLKEAMTAALGAGALQQELNSAHRLAAETKNIIALKESRLQELGEKLKLFS